MEERVEWIKNKVAFFSSFVILGICMYLFFPFPNNVMREPKFMFMSFPIQNQDGYIPLGIVGSILFILALILLFISLSKYQGRTILIVMILYIILPNLLITAYQETFARGITAVSYDNNGHCSFEVIDQKMMGQCDLVLHNRSNEDVSFELEFIDSGFMDDDVRMESLMNLAGPYKITMKANEKKPIHMDELLNLSGVHKHIEGGGSFNIRFKLIDSEKTRTL